MYTPFILYDRSQGFEDEDEIKAREEREALEEMEEDSDEEEASPAGKGAPRRGGDI